METELSPEREEELLTSIAKMFVKYDMAFTARMILIPAKPIAVIADEIATAFIYPFTPLLGSWSEDLLVLFYKRENIDRLVAKIEQLSKEKHEKEKRDPPKTWKQKIKSFINSTS